ncbi:hypothetical protein O3M35_001901 [Rhynocoris fuscipes]|uniref:U1-type domain-containing protein n=1 Tax=Rhynocoris fuscipes TaxID=488301 RepID=A0AAW1CSF2_9HEMI
MNNKWKRKRYFGNWGIGNNNKSQFLKMSQYSRDNWSIKPWHSASNFQGQRNDFQFRPQINQNRRNSCRWETFQEDMNYSFPKESLERNDFQPNSESDLNPFDNEKPRKNSRIFLKWCNDILQEHPNHIRLRMKKNFWDKLDPKDNITISCKEAATKKSASLTPYDGVTPTGLQGMSKAWLCEFCSVVLLDIEHRNSHLMGKNHYLKYAKFCKKYAEKKLLKYKIIKKEIKKKKQEKF